MVLDFSRNLSSHLLVFRLLKVRVNLQTSSKLVPLKEFANHFWGLLISPVVVWQLFCAYSWSAGFCYSMLGTHWCGRPAACPPPWPGPPWPRPPAPPSSPARPSPGPCTAPAPPSESCCNKHTGVLEILSFGINTFGKPPLRSFQVKHY